MHGRMGQAALVIGDRFFVVAGQVVGVAQLEQRAGVAGIQLDATRRSQLGSCASFGAPIVITPIAPRAANSAAFTCAEE